MRSIGLEAFSCDLQHPSGGHPEWHITGDVLPLLAEPWAMIVAFPPCDHLASTGARWFAQKWADRRQISAINFFVEFEKSECDKIAVENPIGIMSTIHRPPDQIINPCDFGDPAEKKTCLWLRGLPPLIPTDRVDPPPRRRFSSGRTMADWYADSWNFPEKDRKKIRSRTFPGIARAMAEQWGRLI